ncbi:XRE family transcriptional regulator [bacterium]|nr:MAG: XRE family transcriptional regulator [bacterium]
MAVAIDPNLGATLRNLRLARGLGLDEASRRSGASKAALSSWENGHRRPRGPALARLLDALSADARTKARLLQQADPQQARIVLADSVLGAPVDVGMVLRVMREGRGMAQADLARQIGVSQAAVSQWESGDALPSAETIHAVGFALGATVEETLALASVQGGKAGELVNDPEAVLTQMWTAHIPSSLREVTLMGWEAELWRRAASDPRWESSLVSILSLRANWLVRTERYEEIPVLAARSIRLARGTDTQSQAVGAVAALADSDRHLGRGHDRAADLAGELVGRMPDSHRKAWMLRQRGMSLVRMGRIAEGLKWVSRSSEMDILLIGDNPESWCYDASMLCEALLEAGEPKSAADIIGGRRERQFPPLTYVSVEHANGRAVTDADIAYLHYWTAKEPSSGPDYRRLFSIERRQAWLKGDRSTHETFKFRSIEPIAPDPETEERLWKAVLRDHRG